MKKIYPYVEDYIELLAGVRPGTIHTTGIAISLARYDMPPIGTFLSQFINGVGLTDRQAGLALKLIGKYQRQFRGHDIGLGDILSDPRYRFSIRVVDRAKTITVADNVIVVKFPFDGRLIDELKKFAKYSEGKVCYHAPSRCWHLALTESCINFAVTFGELKGFNISQDILQHQAAILACEASDFAIRLTHHQDTLCIENAAPSLLEYIADSLGGLHLDNQPRLVDNAAILGYTVSPDLTNVPYAGFALNKIIHIPPAVSDLGELCAYARHYTRLPIISYVAGTKKKNAGLDQFFKEHEILDLSSNTQSIPQDLSTYGLIHLGTVHAKRWHHAVPLLVTYTSMMFGSERSWLLQNAGKVCYYCDTC
jgi:hypothetical protein